MYVRKFEADTLDEALKSVKRELGPDAIILKTVSNKGLKGAFKKGKFEITAAISEQNYTNKARVDRVLNDEQSQKFYQSSAKDINASISSYNQSAGHKTPSYGNMGLNRVVNTVSKASTMIQNSLDDFLSLDEDKAQASNLDGFLTEKRSAAPAREAISQHTQEVDEDEFEPTQEYTAPYRDKELDDRVKSQSHQIEMLEQKLYELTEKFSNSPKENEEVKTLSALRNTLRSLELKEKIVTDIIKKASFEITPEELKDVDLVYDFALREINALISVDMPLFSSSEMGDKQVVTVLVSEGASGQASMAMKLAVLQEDVKIIQYRATSNSKLESEFTKKIFNIEVEGVSSLAHLMSEARKAIADGKSLIIDLKLNFKEEDETKKFLEVLRRSFENVEILTTISAINAEVYNRKILAKYNNFSNGAIISYVDQCLSYGAIVNLSHEFSKTPLKFFGTGPTVPDDIEAATSERLLAGMFEFS